MDRQTNEWCDLDHCSRNLLMWPDFLKWKEQSRFVEIKRDDSNGSLGLVSVDVQVRNQWFVYGWATLQTNTPPPPPQDGIKWPDACPCNFHISYYFIDQFDHRFNHSTSTVTQQ